MSDLLALATRALREETAAPGLAAATTRQRVVGSLRARRSRRASRLGLAVVLVAAAVGSTAWAATGHLRGVSLWLGFGGTPRDGSAASVASNAVAARVATAGSIALAAASSRVTSAEPSVEAPPALADAEPAPVDDEATDPRSVDTSPPEIGGPARVSRALRPAGVSGASPDARPTALATRANASHAPAPSPSLAAEPPLAAPSPAAAASSATDAAADALYTRAHALHFQAHDDAAALAAWDAYLHAAPSGRYAVVARYNRAMCLARLGRAAEADAALRPFADGAEGGYRRGEARALRDALQGGR